MDLNKYTCTLCNYTTNHKSHYDKHLQTKKHKKNENTNQIDIFKCELCNVQYSKKYYFDRHLNSIKHIKNSNANHNCICGEIFSSLKLLDRHKLICVSHYKMVNINSDDNKLLNIIEKQQNMIVEQHQQITVQSIHINDQNKQITYQNKQIKEQNNQITDQNKQITMQINQITDQTKQMTEIIPKLGNTQNNNFNINVFLNEDCKNALNMSDFLKSITISLEQLDFTKNYGLEKGITKVITDNINKLSLTERPIHCTDTKRETLYIKDNNVWEKDKDKSKIKEAIQKTSNKNYNAVSNWAKENPDFMDNENKQEYYTKAITTIGKSIESIDKKIIKTLCKENYIKE
mgnify:CR=1 FL=1|jgi:chromosome segregation ATPase